MPTVEAAGTTFGYQQVGDGDETLLFMHGYLGSAVIWGELLDRLGPRYRCIAVDARGVGESARPDIGYTVQTWSEDVLAVADALGVGRFSYVAHSMGGLTGYRLALDHGDRLSRLVLICPSPAGPPRAGGAAFSAFRAAWVDGDAVAMSRLLASTSVELPDPALTQRRGQIAVTAAEGHVDSLLDDAAELDLRPRLAALEIPTLVLLGAADPALAAGLADFARLSNATLDVMSGVGHVPQLERSAAVADVVARFQVDGPITFATLMGRASGKELSEAN
jgi:pimeloyl-ACP methyl ester carboxylesterase